mmetsp:Transcript_69839/g.158466  ORF Transcript_69839/g.158466 Transcript_69839/m.158466 type:complete len:310 (+) Transcript_69839:69-998(+)
MKALRAGHLLRQATPCGLLQHTWPTPSAAAVARPWVVRTSGGSPSGLQPQRLFSSTAPGQGAQSWVPNEEGSDLAQPLPFKSKEELKDVKIYQIRGSPPCHTVQCFLAYGGIDFTPVEIGILTKRHIRWSNYKKIPIVTFNGLQVNDSLIVLKALTPMVFGRDATPAELAMMKVVNTEVMLEFECQLFGSREATSRFCDVAFSEVTSGPLLKWFVVSRVPSFADRIRAKKPALLSLAEYGKQFREGLQGTFFGGEGPGPADVQLWSLIYQAERLGLPFFEAWLSDTGLGGWYAAVRDHFPKKGSEDMYR